MQILRPYLKSILLIGIATWLIACGGGGGGGDGDGDANQCGTVVDISENAFVEGRLEAGDCTVNDLFPGANDASFVDEFRVTIPAGGTLQITMRSTEIDTFLAVADTTGSCSGGCDPIIILANDDDTAGGANGTDSFISIVLTAGTYMILANSLTTETGNYNLETIFI